METLEEGTPFTSPKLLLFASEPLTRREFDLYREHFDDDCLIVNQMGTSESYNYHLFTANKESLFEGSNVPAGYPVSGARQGLLFAENHNEVGEGEVG